MFCKDCGHRLEKYWLYSERYDERTGRKLVSVYYYCSPCDRWYRRGLSVYNSYYLSYENKPTGDLRKLTWLQDLLS